MVSLCLFEHNFTAAVTLGHIFKVNKKHRKIHSLSIIFEDFVVILKSWKVQADVDVLILAFELCGQASVMRTRTGTGTFDIHGDEDVNVQWWSAFNFKSESIFGDLIPKKSGYV